MRGFKLLVGLLCVLAFDLALDAPARAWWGNAFGNIATTSVTNSGALTSVGPNVLNGGTTLGGGTTVQNLLDLPAGATAYVSGAVVYSTYTFTEIDLAGKTFGGVSGLASHFTNCVSGSTITWTADGISTYTVTASLSLQIGSGANTFGLFAVLDGTLPSFGGKQSTSKSLKSCYLTSLETRDCEYIRKIGPGDGATAGTHTVCLGQGQTNFGDTVTIGGSVWPSASTFSLGPGR